MSKSRVEEIIDRLGDEFKAVATAGLISAGTMGAHAAEPTSPEPSNAGHQITVTADNPNPLQVTPVEQGYSDDYIMVGDQKFYPYITWDNPHRAPLNLAGDKTWFALAISEKEYNKIVEGKASDADRAYVNIIHHDGTYKRTKIGSDGTGNYTNCHYDFIGYLHPKYRQSHGSYYFDSRVDRRTNFERNTRRVERGLDAIGDAFREGTETIREGKRLIRSLGFGSRDGRR